MISLQNLRWILDLQAVHDSEMAAPTGWKLVIAVSEAELALGVLRAAPRQS